MRTERTFALPLERYNSPQVLYAAAQRVWEISLLSLPLDFLLALGAALLPIPAPSPALMLLIVISAWLSSSPEVTFAVMSFLRELKRSPSLQSARFKSIMFFSALAVIGLLDLLLRAAHTPRSIPLAAVIIGVAITFAGAYRGLAEVSAQQQKLAANPQLADQIINAENLARSLTPIILLRFAAFLCVWSLVVHGTDASCSLLYAAVLLSFPGSAPQHGDFLAACRSCSKHFPKTSAAVTRCRRCESGNGLGTAKRVVKDIVQSSAGGKYANAQTRPF